ncbi:MAG: beta-eliminating lyase-related protein, partial [Gemmatimonadota bacterium]|nr:beta-eliminating lyase-related protein [Gemmatimonadota bacterium]
MARAEVGDDVLDGDPTTRQLEAMTSELLGKERALFFPSGVQANQVAVGLLGRAGAEVVVEAASHIFNYEEGAAPQLWGVQLRPVETPDGILAVDLAAAAF